MNILITGGAGFIGSNLSKRLLEEGHKLWVVDNLLTGNIENVEPFLKENSNFQFLKCGVEEQAFLDFCYGSGVRFDRVYHLACPTGVPNIEILGEEMLMACSVGTWNVLQVAKKSDADLLYTSSSEVYGEPLKTPQDETYTGNVETLGLRANYEEGKRFSETLVKHFVRKYGLRAKMVRLFNTYGPNMSFDDMRVISRFITQALTNKPLTVQGDGSQSRTLCYVDDTLDGFEAVMSKGEAGEVYNLGGDSSITMKKFAELIIDLTGSNSTLQYIERPAHDHTSRMPVLDKIRALGWNNNVDLQTGLEKTLEDFKMRMLEKSSYSVNTETLQPQLQS